MVDGVCCASLSFCFLWLGQSFLAKVLIAYCSQLNRLPQHVGRERFWISVCSLPARKPSPSEAELEVIAPALLFWSLVDHVSEQGKHNNVEAGESKQYGFVCEVIENCEVVEPAKCEQCCQDDDEGREQSHRGKVHACSQNQLGESQGISDGLDMAFANSFGIADRCEFNGIAIPQQANRDGCCEAESVWKKFEKISKSIFGENWRNFDKG